VKIVIYGLTITSSWGNGHATTYRSLAKALARRGHCIHFIEKDVEWYRSNRDLPHPEFCAVHLYENWSESRQELIKISADADAIVIGSYCSDGAAITKELLDAGYGPIAFYDIDTPITMARLRTGTRMDYLDASLIPFYGAYLSFTGGPILQELERQFKTARAIAFYCSVDPEIYRPTQPCNEYLCELSYLGTYAPDRQGKLANLLCGAAALLPQSDFLVAGPQYPSTISWPHNVRRIIHVSPAGHPAFFSSSRYSLNLTREDMIAAGHSPSVRLFEASACGAAILTDGWPGLEEFLTPGEEVMLPRDEYETVDILRNGSDIARARMGRRARERILSQHTAAHRAVQFEAIVDQFYADTSAVGTSSSSEPRHMSGCADDSKSFV
jgi:spore maturation protein CgeB